MSKNSEEVKKWRANCKNRIVDAMGGSCVVCGYMKCNSSLVLHHLDPSKKEFGLGSIRANPKKWSTIVEEIKKCVLVCHNCHYEIHEGVTFLPETYATFDPKFEDYKELEKTVPLTKCLMCDTLKPEYKKMCSNRCTLAYANTFKK